MQTIEPRQSKGWLEEAYRKRKRGNAAYSLRAFARFLGVSSGRLSEFFSGKRILTELAASKIAVKLAFSPEETASFMGLVRQERSEKRRGPVLSISTADGATPAEQDYRQLSLDAFHAIAEWHHFAILSLMDTQSFRPEAKWIARRLGISVIEVHAALDRLKRLELIEETSAKGRRRLATLRRTAAHLTTSQDISSAALRRSHRETLEQTITALEEVPIERRDITSISLAIDPRKIPEAKKLIKDFRRKLSAYLESGARTEVYNLNIQLVPVSIPEKEGL